MNHKSPLLALFLFISVFSHAQSETEHYYVTIGVFETIDNAVHFTNNANKQNFNAHYAIHPERKLYYVYILESDDKQKAFAFLTKIKVETEYKTAWIFTGKLGETPIAEVIKKEPVPEPAKEKPIIEQPIVTEPVKEPTKDPVAEPPVAKVDSSTFIKKEVKKPEGKPFFFKLVDGESGAEVIGEVHILASPRATQYQSFPINEIVYIKTPQTGVMQIITVAAGYREMKRSINYNDPAASAAEVGTQQEAIISFPLVKVKLGDYIEFSNVRFFANSALLQPESKNELDGLVSLMKENKKYKVKVHGHCNGNDPRDIASKGTSTEFFSTGPGNLREKVSALRLTELRADLIKEYLVSQGIEENRIATKGEGGKAMIYPQNSTLSARNDRVEMEVLKGR